MICMSAKLLADEDLVPIPVLVELCVDQGIVVSAESEVTSQIDGQLRLVRIGLFLPLLKV